MFHGHPEGLRQRPWHVGRSANERLPETQIEMNRSRNAGHRSSKCIPGHVSPAETHLWLRRAGFAVPTNGGAKEIPLVDRLWRPNTLQLGRSIRRDHQHRDGRLVRLDDR